jgi:hypothetical protein
MRKVTRLGLGITVVLSCGSLLVACAGGEPPTPAPVVMGGTGQDRGVSNPSDLPRVRPPAPSRVTTEFAQGSARHPSTPPIASTARRAAAASKARHGKHSMHVKNDRAPTKRHLKLASAHPAHKRAAQARTVPLDTRRSASSGDRVAKSLSRTGKSAWVYPAPAQQPSEE